MSSFVIDFPIAVGTGSKIKINAAKRAFPDAEIVAIPDTESGVSSQPIGKDETRRGAINRARCAQKSELAMKHQCKAFIGMENGMWLKDDAGGKSTKNNNTKDGGDDDTTAAAADDEQWEDAAIVVMILPVENGKVSEQNDIILEALSEAIDIPPKDKRPFEGGANGEWSILKDPHAVLTEGKKPREEFLVEALMLLKEKVGTSKI